MRLVVTIPANQSCIASVLKKEFQRWRFNAAVAKQNIHSSMMARGCFIALLQMRKVLSKKVHAAGERLADPHHSARCDYFCIAYGRRGYSCPSFQYVSAEAKGISAGRGPHTKGVVAVGAVLAFRRKTPRALSGGTTPHAGFIKSFVLRGTQPSTVNSESCG